MLSCCGCYWVSGLLCCCASCNGTVRKLPTLENSDLANFVCSSPCLPPSLLHPTESQGYSNFGSTYFRNKTVKLRSVYLPIPVIKTFIVCGSDGMFYGSFMSAMPDVSHGPLLPEFSAPANPPTLPTRPLSDNTTSLSHIKWASSVLVTTATFSTTTVSNSTTGSSRLHAFL